jgi:Flp pilus assembly pilin Flp
VIEAVVGVQLWLEARWARVSERGATATEYAILMGVLAIFIIVGAVNFANRVKRSFNDISNTLPL